MGWICRRTTGAEMDVKYSVKAFAISLGFDICFPSISMYAGDFGVGFIGVTRFKIFAQIFYIVFIFHDVLFEII